MSTAFSGLLVESSLRLTNFNFITLVHQFRAKVQDHAKQALFEGAYAKVHAADVKGKSRFYSAGDWVQHQKAVWGLAMWFQLSFIKSMPD